MRIYAVVAHDRKDSLTYHIFNELTALLSKQDNVTVDILDLYDHAQEIPFYTHDKTALAANDFYQKNKERFMAADRLLLVFPVYWYSTPGIMKCWIDLITSYAYKYTGKRYAEPLHSIKKVLIINSTMAPWWQNIFIFHNHVNQQLKSTFAFMGIKNITSYTISSVYKKNNDSIQQDLAQIKAAANKFII